ncbi:MAG: helix-turn-helix domain-containing protein [Breznakia sp.]
MKKKEELQTIFTKNLRFYLTQQHKTQLDLIRDLEFSAGIISEWMNGKKYPRMERIEILANYFHIPKSYLIEDATIPIYTSFYDYQNKTSQHQIYTEQDVDFACTNIHLEHTFLNPQDIYLLKILNHYEKHTLVLYHDEDMWAIDNIIKLHEQNYILSNTVLPKTAIIAKVIEIRKTSPILL